MSATKTREGEDARFLTATTIAMRVTKMATRTVITRAEVTRPRMRRVTTDYDIGNMQHKRVGRLGGGARETTM